MKRTFLTTIVLLTMTSTLVIAAASAQRGDRGSSGVELREPHHDGPVGPISLEDDPDRPDPRRPMTDQEIDEALDVVVTLYPGLAERLNQLKQDDPRRLRRTIEKRFPRVRFLVMLKQRDPAMYELRLQDIRLERQTHALGKAIRQARADDDKDRYKELREQLEQRATEHFEARQTIREREIEMLRAKLEQLEERLDDRADDRKDLIEQRVNELAGPEW